MLHLLGENLFAFLLAFIPALINLGLLFYIVAKLPRNSVSIIFSLLIVCMILWQVNDALGRVVQTVELEDRIDAFMCWGWLFIGPLCVHFTLEYAGLMKRNRNILLLVYIPAVFFFTVFEAHFYEHRFILTEFWGWTNFHNYVLIDTIMVYWISACVITSNILIIYHTLRIRNNKLLRTQSMVIAIGMLIPTLAGIIAQVIFPIFLHRDSVPLTSTFMTSFSLGTVIGLSRYKLFTISDLITTEDVLQTLPVILFAVNKDSRITYLTEYAIKVLDMPKHELIGLTLQEMTSIKKGDETCLTWMFEKSLQREDINDIPCSINGANALEVLVSSTPIINNNGVQGVLFSAKDITEVTRSKEVIEQHKEQLEEAQHLSHVGSWEWDVKTGAVRWSKEMYNLYGLDQGTPITYENYFDLIPEEERQMAKQAVDAAAAAGKSFEFYHSLHNKFGKTILFARGNIVAKNGELLRMNGTVQDVTASKTNEKILRYQNEELQKINAELDRFVYSISHDLRAPLTSVAGLLGLAENIAEDKLLTYIKMSKANIAKLDKFILDVLDYSKNSRMDIKAEPVHFNELINEKIEALRYIVPADKEVQFNCKVEDGQVFLSDRTRIGIIVNNLLSNALKYHNREESVIKIDITTVIDKECATVTIKDNGVGIAGKDREKVFDMFYRASKESTGSGLGLYIVKETVLKLKGSITLSSTTREGSEFIIILPNLANHVAAG